MSSDRVSAEVKNSSSLIPGNKPKASFVIAAKEDWQPSKSN